MDVAVDPEFAKNGWVYFAYSHGRPGEGRVPAMTRIVRKFSGSKSAGGTVTSRRS